MAVDDHTQASGGKLLEHLYVLNSVASALLLLFDP